MTDCNNEWDRLKNERIDTCMKVDLRTGRVVSGEMFEVKGCSIFVCMVEEPFRLVPYVSTFSTKALATGSASC